MNASNYNLKNHFVRSEDVQHIHIYMDDSGKLSKSEDYSIFAGIVFTNHKDGNALVSKYKGIINEIKYNYHLEPDAFINGYPEIKGHFLKKGDRRRILNLGKGFTTFCAITLNKNVYSNIMNDKASKGRFIEYVQKRTIKKCVKYLIHKNKIDPKRPVYLHIKIDEMPTKSSGYYSLNAWLKEELLYGIINFNYQRRVKPILFDNLKVDLRYVDSKTDQRIQFSDVLANTVRASLVKNPNIFSTRDYLKKTLKIDVIMMFP